MADAGRKIALLIGVGEYGTGLKPLKCPVNGVAAMKMVLENPEIGGFDRVVPITNPDVGRMRTSISTTLAQTKKDDLVLFYFTGHGVKTVGGDFYLTTAQSQLFENGNLNTGTAVEADFVKRELRNCYAERKVVVLDCCFGAAFADGFLTMDDGAVDVDAHLGGKGWCVMTAATSRAYALEQVGEELSVYTRYLVEGLKTGGAALDGQSFVSVRHWHNYVEKQVKAAAPTTNPAIFNGLAGENIRVAKAKVDRLQRYRKQVQKKVRRGRLSAAVKTELSAYWQPLLGITPEQAKEIEDEVLKPYREKAKHVALYVKALAEEKEVGYPFDDELIAEFRSLQRTYGLSARDVQTEEKRILGEQMRAQPAAQVETREVLEKLESYPVFGFETVHVNEKTETQALLNAQRKQKALPIVEQMQWIAAGSAFVDPLPSLELLASTAINSQMIVDLGAVYGQRFSMEQAKTAAGTLAELLVKWGYAELSTQLLGSLLKTHAVTYAAGAVLQGVSAAYLTRLIGLSLIEFFEEQSSLPKERRKFAFGEIGDRLQRIFRVTKQKSRLQSFVQQTLNHLPAADFESFACGEDGSG